PLRDQRLVAASAVSPAGLGIIEGLIGKAENVHRGQARVEMRVANAAGERVDMGEVCPGQLCAEAFQCLKGVVIVGGTEDNNEFLATKPEQPVFGAKGLLEQAGKAQQG